MGGIARGTTRIGSRGKGMEWNGMEWNGMECNAQCGSECVTVFVRLPINGLGAVPPKPSTRARSLPVPAAEPQPTDHSRGGPCGLAAAVRHTSYALDALKLPVSK